VRGQRHAPAVFYVGKEPLPIVREARWAPRPNWTRAENLTPTVIRSAYPGTARFSARVQTGTGAHPAYCTMGTGFLPGLKSVRGVTLTPHPLLVPWSRKSRAIPLLLLWAVRPVQNLSACTTVHLTPHHLLVPWSRKSRAIALLPLWAVWPVHSLSACTTVHLTPRPF